MSNPKTDNSLTAPVVASRVTHFKERLLSGATEHHFRNIGQAIRDVRDMRFTSFTGVHSRTQEDVDAAASFAERERETERLVEEFITHAKAGTAAKGRWKAALREFKSELHEQSLNNQTKAEQERYKRFDTTRNHVIDVRAEQVSRAESFSKRLKGS